MSRSLIQQIFDLFKEPESFEDDPVRWSYGQMGHGYVGLSVACHFTALLFAVGGAYPDQVAVAVFVCLGYLLWWELELQGWRGWDTLIDTTFFVAGATLFVFIDMREIIWILEVWVVFTNSALLGGITYIIKRQARA